MDPEEQSGLFLLCPSKMLQRQISKRKKQTTYVEIRGLSRKYEPRHEISNHVVCAISKGSDQPALMCSLIRAFASRLNIL